VRHCSDHWSLQPPRRRWSSERCEPLDRRRGFTSAESAAQEADFAVRSAENGIRLDPAWGLSVEAISARFSSLKPSLLSPHSTIRKSRRASESLRHSLAAGDHLHTESITPSLPFSTADPCIAVSGNTSAATRRLCISQTRRSLRAGL
jgi:hypothetical protein